MLRTPILALLLLANRLQAHDGYPDFSWDRVPVYAHVGVGRGLKPEEYEFLARHYSFITFTGGAIDATFRRDDSISAETVIADAARTIKQHNPRAKVLMYWAADMPKPQWKISNAAIPEGGLITYQRRKGMSPQLFDFTQPGMRSWWSDVAAHCISAHHCDGLYVDGATSYRPAGPMDRFLGDEKRTALDEGMFQTLQATREKMGARAILLFNPLHAASDSEPEIGQRYLPATDGAMIDDFDRAANDPKKRQSKEYLAATIRMMSDAARDGKIVIFKAWPGFTWWSDKDLMKQPAEAQLTAARENLTFPLACFLIGAGEHSYFNYTWGWTVDQGALAWYPEFDKPLGAPKADATREGWTFRREFEHASVFVDVEKKTARIDWK